MEVFPEELIGSIYTLSPLSINLIFFSIAWLENILPPLPGDLLLVFGGYLAAEQLVGFANLLVLTAVASVIGFMTMYGIGSYWGYRIQEQREESWLLRVIGMKYFARGKRWMQIWGQWVIVANRFLPGTRSVISLTSGIYRTNVKNTIISSAVSSLLWNGILLQLGWMVHENWLFIGHYLNIYGKVILSGFVLLVLLYLSLGRLRKRGYKKEL